MRIKVSNIVFFMRLINILKMIIIDFDCGTLKLGVNIFVFINFQGPIPFYHPLFIVSPQS